MSHRHIQPMIINTIIIIALHSATFAFAQHTLLVSDDQKSTAYKTLNDIPTDDTKVTQLPAFAIDTAERILSPIFNLFDLFQQNLNTETQHDRQPSINVNNQHDYNNPIDSLLAPIFRDTNNERRRKQQQHQSVTSSPLDEMWHSISRSLTANLDATRRKIQLPIDIKNNQPHQPVDFNLFNLLESLGADSSQHNRKEDVQIGRDRTVSILGMPIGRRDGMQLSPMKGITYGNQDMYGPVAINDQYKLNWDNGILGQLSHMVQRGTQHIGQTLHQHLSNNRQ